jgi:hypothetical protein
MPFFKYTFMYLQKIKCRHRILCFIVIWSVIYLQKIYNHRMPTFIAGIPLFGDRNDIATVSL